MLRLLSSIGILSAYHNPAEDPPVEQVRASTNEKMAKLVAEEKAWMEALVSKAEG